MRVNGETIKLTVTALTLMLTEQLMLVSGLKISSMARELRHGLMEQSMTGNTLKGKNMAEAP